MGYRTSYKGIIELESKRAIKLIKSMIKNEENPFDETNGITLKKNKLMIDVYWKGYMGYMGYMFLLCYFVTKIDKYSNGKLICIGDSGEDNWKIEIENGRIIGIDDDNIILPTMNEEYKKNLYKYCEDEELKKQLIIGEL